MTNEEMVTELLKMYPTLKSKLKTELILKDTKAYSLPGAMTNRAVNSFHSDVEQYISEKDMLEGESLNTYLVIKAVEAGLQCLTNLECTIIRMKYFRRMTYIQIEVEIDKSTKTIQKYKNRALKRLIKSGLPKIYQEFTKKLP